MVLLYTRFYDTLEALTISPLGPFTSTTHPNTDSCQLGTSVRQLYEPFVPHEIECILSSAEYFGLWLRWFRNFCLSNFLPIRNSFDLVCESRDSTLLSHPTHPDASSPIVLFFLLSTNIKKFHQARCSPNVREPPGPNVSPIVLKMCAPWLLFYVAHSIFP